MLLDFLIFLLEIIFSPSVAVTLQFPVAVACRDAL